MADKKLGPRVSVVFQSGAGRGAKAKPQYVFMLKSIAEALGFKIVPNPTVARTAPKNSKSKAKEIRVVVRGTVGAKHIKVPVPGGAGGTGGAGASSSNAKVKYFSIPVPSGANITSIRKFLQKASKKPETFVSPNGRTHSVTTASRGRKNP